MAKTSLHVITLFMCAVMGLWAVGHGFALAARVSALTLEGVRDYLGEISLSIAGGICVLSVAVEQLNCWRTHHKESELF
jgi:hypothetical protein